MQKRDEQEYIMENREQKKAASGRHATGAARAGGRSNPKNAVRARTARKRRAGGGRGVILRLSDLLSTPKGILTVIACFLAVALLIVGIGLLSSRSGGTDRVRAPEQALAGADGDAEALGSDAPEASPTEEPVAVAPTPEPRADETWRDGQYAPEPQGENYLPVFIQADRQDKVIAITVDDCFQTENLQQILQLAEETGGRITIFPIGELLQRPQLQEVIRSAYASGHEIENHTWSHDSLYNLSAEQLASHVFNQDRAVDLVLGVNHHAHFLRPRGGDDRNDLRTHSYVRQLGYYGIAHWSVSGTDSSISKINASLKPGQVYLFHCIDSDLEKLKAFIPYAAGQGYRLVTMNEMFGYGPNYEEPLTDDPRTREIVQLEPYERDYKTIKATTYDYAVYEVQAALKKAGYLKGNPDGIYGKGTAKRAAEWQKANGFKADGILTPEQQRKLFGVD